jgi:Na+/H+ antiporter NhaD/arsenite permease-like protein
MTFDQAAVIAVIVVTMALFVWGRWRYDIVAILALLTVVYLGIVAPEDAFSGFGHPAVVTVAAVLVISRAMQASGVVDHLVRLLAPTRRDAVSQIAGASSLAAVLSAFMNNVGALALMLPVTLRNAYRAGRPPSQVLMPLSFATLLGGLITLIGTPPNIATEASPSTCSTSRRSAWRWPRSDCCSSPRSAGACCRASAPAKPTRRTCST